MATLFDTELARAMPQPSLPGGVPVLALEYVHTSLGRIIR